MPNLIQNVDFNGFSIHLLHQDGGWKYLIERGEWAMFNDRPFANDNLALQATKSITLGLSKIETR